jgi:hypothetical protein
MINVFVALLYRQFLNPKRQAALAESQMEKDALCLRCVVGERMISACVFPTVKHRVGGVMVWGCFAGDTVCDLFRIQGTLNQHGYYSILQ